MRLFLIIIVLFCSILIGIKIKNYFIKREKFFLEVVKLAEIISNEISYRSEKLILIIEKCFNNFDSSLNACLATFRDYLKNIISKQELKNKIKKELNFLNDDEVNLFFNFLFSLGEQTKEEEIINILNYKKRICNFYDDAKIKNNKYSNLYLKLFIVLGLTIGILFL